MKSTTKSSSPASSMKASRCWNKAVVTRLTSEKLLPLAEKASTPLKSKSKQDLVTPLVYLKRGWEDIKQMQREASLNQEPTCAQEVQKTPKRNSFLVSTFSTCNTDITYGLLAGHTRSKSLLGTSFSPNTLAAKSKFMDVHNKKGKPKTLRKFTEASDEQCLPLKTQRKYLSGLIPVIREKKDSFMKELQLADASFEKHDHQVKSMIKPISMKKIVYKKPLKNQQGKQKCFELPVKRNSCECKNLKEQSVEKQQDVKVTSSSKSKTGWVPLDYHKLNYLDKFKISVQIYKGKSGSYVARTPQQVPVNKLENESNSVSCNSETDS